MAEVVQELGFLAQSKSPRQLLRSGHACLLLRQSAITTTDWCSASSAGALIEQMTSCSTVPCFIAEIGYRELKP